MMFKMRTGNESRNGSRTRRTALRRMLLAFAVMLACLCLPASAQAASKASKALKAYNKVLKSGKRNGMKIKFFALQDVNGDGVKELFLMNGNNYSGVRDFTKILICGYKNSKVVTLYNSGTLGQLWTLEGDVHCWSSKKAVEIYGTAGTSESYTFLQISKKLSVTKKKFYSDGEEDWGGWKINGKKVSWSKYKSQLRKWKKNIRKGTSTLLKVYNNNAYNRKKHC